MTLETRYAYASIRISTEAMKNSCPFAMALGEAIERHRRSLSDDITVFHAALTRTAARRKQYRRRATRRGSRKRGRRM